MKNIIAIESSSDICGASLFIEGELKDIVEVCEPRVHVEKLPVFVNNLVKRNEVKIHHLDGLAVSAGPGSYTGLRIGMSLIKGLAFSVELPVIMVPTLHALNNQIEEAEVHWIGLYSHRDVVFSQKFHGKKVVSPAQCIKGEELSEFPVYGYGLEKVLPDFQKVNEIIPSSKIVGEAALQNYHLWIESDINKMQPNYISEFNIG